MTRVDSRRARELSSEASILVETLIALPALAAVFASVLGLSAMYAAKLEAKGASRRLAWLQADSGSCPARACEHPDCRALEREVGASLLHEPARSGQGRLSLRSFLGDVGRFFIGGVTHGVGSASVRLPAWFDAELTSQSGVTTLLCNTTARHATDGESVLDHACQAGLEMMEYAGEVCR